MKKYSDFYATKDCPKSSFFIGANTPKGFSASRAQYFRESELTRLYIIKGGPGTGKSTIMNSAAKIGEYMGADVTRLYCSSDPDSLDGVIIKKGKVRLAVCDGTAPHTLDPALPGCCSEIINCGDAWNSKILEERRAEIAALSAAKSVAFERAYAFISAAEGIKATIKKSACAYTNSKKLRAYAASLVKKLPREKRDAIKEYCITEAISMKGGVRLSTFDRAEILIGVRDYAFCCHEFFRYLSEELERSGRSQLISLSPMGDISEIYLPDAKIAFTAERESMDYSKTVNLKRFVNEKISDDKAKRRFHERFFTELMYAATDTLAEAKKHHFALEEIYVSAMDFESLDRIAEGLYEKIKNALM